MKRLKEHYSKNEMEKLLIDNVGLCISDRKDILDVISMLPFHNLKELAKTINIIARGK
jgi:hypothetical protein